MNFGIRTILLAVIPITLFSCGNGEKVVSPETEPVAENTYEPLRTEAELDAYRMKVDSIGDSLIVSSLRYSKENGAYVEVQASLDKNSQIIRVIEDYGNADNAGFGKNIFYYQNGVKRVAVSRFEKRQGEEATFVERISYFDENGKVERTKEREASFEGDLENFEFRQAGKQDIPDDRAFRALQEQGEFETTFQGFVDAGPQTYLIVGENKKGGYTSALALRYVDPSLQNLRDHAEEMLGKKVEVTFVKKIDGSVGFEFQELDQIHIVTE